LLQRRTRRQIDLNIPLLRPFADVSPTKGSGGRADTVLSLFAPFGAWVSSGIIFPLSCAGVSALAISEEKRISST